MYQPTKSRKALNHILGADLAAAVLRLAPTGCRQLPAWVDVRDRGAAFLIGEGDDLYAYEVAVADHTQATLASHEHSSLVCHTVPSKHCIGMMPRPGYLLVFVHAQGYGPKRRWTCTLAFCPGDGPAPAEPMDAPVRGI